VSLAKKFRDVVAANFIEIARSDAPAESVSKTSEEAAKAAAAAAAGGAALDAAAERARTDAETELDSLLTPLPAVPVPLAPEPEPILPRLLDAVNGEGVVDFDRIYSHQGHKLPSFTAEQAMNMLTSMPRDLPLKVKRVTVRATLDAIGSVVGATPKDIVADALAKKEHLETYLGDMEEQADGEFERLQQEIAERQAALKDAQRKREWARDAVRSRLDVLDQVTAFFDYDDTESAPAPDAPGDETDADGMPSFMDEEAVLRMLGLAAQEQAEREAAEAAASGADAAQETEETAAAGRKGGRRVSR
jgi:hypothetical protein